MWSSGGANMMQAWINRAGCDVGLRKERLSFLCGRWRSVVWRSGGWTEFFLVKPSPSRLGLHGWLLSSSKVSPVVKNTPDLESLLCDSPVSKCYMCLLCFIYHLASVLTMLLSGWPGELCVCTCPTQSNRQAGAHRADCLAAKEVQRPVALSYTHPAELRRCPGTVSALVCISPCQRRGRVEGEVTSMASRWSPSCPADLLPSPLCPSHFLISRRLPDALLHPKLN